MARDIKFRVPRFSYRNNSDGKHKQENIPIKGGSARGTGQRDLPALPSGPALRPRAPAGRTTKPRNFALTVESWTRIMVYYSRSVTDLAHATGNSSWFSPIQTTKRLISLVLNVSDDALEPLVDQWFLHRH